MIDFMTMRLEKASVGVCHFYHGRHDEREATEGLGLSLRPNLSVELVIGQRLHEEPARRASTSGRDPGILEKQGLELKKSSRSPTMFDC
jgi:hypothetical protein